MPLELVPAFYSALFQLRLGAHHLYVAAALALVDRQRQAPVTFLRDHPIVHVVEPFQLPRAPERGLPLHAVGGVLHRLAQVVHRDEPLVDEAEHEFRVATPAHRVAVCVRHDAVQNAFLFQAFEDVVVHIGDVPARQPVESVDVVAVLRQGRDERQVMLLAKLEVLGAGAGGDVDHAGALIVSNVAPLKDAVYLPGFRLRGKLVERTAVAKPGQLRPRQLFEYLVVAVQHLEQLFAQVKDLAAVPDFDVCVLWMDRNGHIRGEGPRCRGPQQQALVLVFLVFGAQEGELQVHGVVCDLPVALGHDFVLRQARTAARAPGHAVSPLVDPTALMAPLQEPPDRVVVLVRHRVIRVVPVHPHREPLRLFRDDVCIADYARLALLDEFVDPVVLDIVL